MKCAAAIVLVGFLSCFGTAYSFDLEDVVESLVESCVSSSDFNDYLSNNKKPTVIVDSFRNHTGEHINTSSLTEEFETALKKNSGGIGLSLIPENKEEGGGHIAENVPWQVQGGVRVKLFDLLYTRAQVAYLHNGEVNLSLHLGLALF